MPLYKGNTKVGAIYKGTTQYGKVYKGSTLVFESAKWLPYYYEYLYNDLVPTTIDSKNVKDKAKVATIYGKSVVENQLNEYGDLQSVDGYYGLVNSINDTTLSVNNGVLTVTLSVSASSGVRIVSRSNIQIIANHKYLVSTMVKSSVALSSSSQRIGTSSESSLGSVSANVWTQRCSILSSPVNDLAQSVWFFKTASAMSSNDTIELKNAMCIDLTQMFPFDTPTTLTDNRVQAILNRGYIPYNTGDIKSVDIGEIESEPYNLFDGELENGQIYGSTGAVVNNNYMLITDYISVLPNKSYTLERNSLPSTRSYFFFYDKDKNILSYDSNSNSSWNKTMPNNCLFVRLQFYNNDVLMPVPSLNDVCLHLQGTRIGYAPYVAPQTLQLKYQGSGVGTAHDTMEIGKENVVFTKRMGNYTFRGSETFQDWSGTGKSLTILIPNLRPTLSNNEIANIIWGLGMPTYVNNVNNSSEYDIAVNTNGRLYIATTKTSSQLASALVGKTFEYELATPQVITIPRKHLGVVDLGSLNWNKQGIGTEHSRFSCGNAISNPNAANNVIANIYCSRFLSDTIDHTYTHAQNNIIATANGTVQVWSSDYDNLDATAFKQAMQGQYLYYETETEVADMLDTIGVQAGGTLTSNWFSWNENQLFVPRSSVTASNVEVTNNNDGSLTLNGTATSENYLNITNNAQFPISFIQGNKYLLSGGNTNAEISAGAASITGEWVATTPKIFTSNSTASSYIRVRIVNDVTYNNVKIIPQLIDLTLAFGAGKEPTSINDPRIQHILSEGYIPYNTTGTKVSVDPNVLPNALLNYKCK